MDIISQLQEQVNSIAHLAFNTIGTLQRDAPPNRLSPNYPEPPPAQPAEDGSNFADQPKLMSTGLVKDAKQFDALVAALPISEGGEEAQLKRIAQLQAENDAIGQELQKQLEAAGVRLLKFGTLYLLLFVEKLNLRFNKYHKTEFQQLEELQDKESPNFVKEIFSLYFTDTTNRQFLEIERTFHQESSSKQREYMKKLILRLKGSVLSIGAVKILREVNKMRDFFEEGNMEGFVAAFEQVKIENENLRVKTDPYFQLLEQVDSLGK